MTIKNCIGIGQVFIDVNETIVVSAKRFKKFYNILFLTLPIAILALFYKMRQLKGKVKESKKEKRERKKDFAENKRRFFTVALPVITVLIAVLIFFIYVSTRDKRRI